MAGHTINQAERQSVLSHFALHGSITLPPHDNDYYATAVAGNLLVAGFAFTLLRQGFGWASNVWLTNTAHGSDPLDSGDFVTVNVVGVDENYDPVNELITLSQANQSTLGGTLAAAWGNVCFSRIDSATVVAMNGLTSGETIALGVGLEGGVTTPAIRIPHLLPGRSATSVRFQTIAAAPTVINPAAAVGTTADGLPGRYLTVNYGAVAMRAVNPLFIGLSRDGLI